MPLTLGNLRRILNEVPNRYEDEEILISVDDENIDEYLKVNNISVNYLNNDDEILITELILETE